MRFEAEVTRACFNDSVVVNLYMCLQYSPCSRLGVLSSQLVMLKRAPLSQQASLSICEASALIRRTVRVIYTNPPPFFGILG